MDGLNKRRIALATGAAALLAVGAFVHPSADIRIITHEMTDTAPRKAHAARCADLRGPGALLTRV